MLRRFLAGLLVLALAACARTQAPGPVHFFAEGMPAALADWNVVYVADGRLRLNDGVLPYDLATPLFTDYAHKLRTVWMPAGQGARYEAQDSFDFPVGTILSKTFYYPLADAGKGDRNSVLRTADAGPDLRGGGLELDKVRLVETRLLVRRKDGWVALPYVWNAEQTEATLMRGGALVELDLVGAGGKHEQANYAVPDQNQCAGCHGTDLKSKALSPIGPKARHLNRDFAYAHGSANQLAHWQQVGYLTGVPAGGVPADVAWNDAKAPLDARARAYLDVNCGHCHSEKGAARTSGMWLDAKTEEMLRLGRCKLPIAAGMGTGDRTWDIEPGKPDASIMPYRLASTDPSVMMPELGRSVVHEEGVALIREWIAGMDAEDCGR
ncbi:MAG TPA: SO2930 family diheme c-type cytochrome [Thermomonas sp.]|nr:SO2930 family diheme c-type cytochrome [Thermomonas sp.]